MKILVVHRQKTTVEAIQSVLSRCKPVVRYADSGLDGLLTSRIEHFDLIICGTDLPVITGFELVRSIRTNSVNRTATVFFLNDETDGKTHQLSSPLGVSAVLNMEDISERLADLVDASVKSTKSGNLHYTGFRVFGLSFFLLLYHLGEHTVENRKNHAERQCPPKANNSETWHEIIDQQDHQGIDYHQENSE